MPEKGLFAGVQIDHIAGIMVDADCRTNLQELNYEGHQ